MKTIEELGWRRLRNGEIIQKGDRIWGVTGQWIDCDPVTEVIVDETMKVIRPQNSSAKKSKDTGNSK